MYDGIIDPKQVWNLIVGRVIQIYKQVSHKGLFTHKPEWQILAQNWIKDSKKIASSGNITW